MKEIRDVRKLKPRLKWERPALRRLDASDAQMNSNMMGSDLNVHSGFFGTS